MDQVFEERSWSELPNDTLDLIYLHVFVQSPYLMASPNDEKAKAKIFHPVFDNAYYVNAPVDRIASSNFGWLLLNYGGFLSFIYPFTNDRVITRITVPSVFYDDEFQIYNFSSPPTSSDCTIIAMKNNNSSGGTDIGIIKRGEKQWSLTNFSDFDSFKTSYCNAVFFEGRYYFMGDEFKIGIFDVNASDWKVCDTPLVPCQESYLYRPLGMVEDNGGMLVVYESCEHQKLYVVRFDLLKMIWEKVDCLGDDKVLYVSECASYLETVAAKGMGNRIYFPKFYGGSGVFYSLDTKKYHSNNGKYCSKGPYGSVQSRFATWIKPNYSRINVKEHSDIKDFSDPVLAKQMAPIQEGE